MSLTPLKKTRKNDCPNTGTAKNKNENKLNMILIFITMQESRIILDKLLMT